ncbi:MarR family winged helix-turn-helix transcriptional regulator [Kineococcus aurantiacus]|uniref:DNA-binding MarR family transcriptional regulator n=1 Tax=Kineococcus aurantiacus TaxID=37633 RepID=A0A7Y9ATU1_9ACTN|nr:MarR family transcriptional regulator [Kineococcus aurantiacus]NYD21873.1 DNA-binding MarR family transcriptional regulator [Kineococcus aurantiacus]
MDTRDLAHDLRLVFGALGRSVNEDNALPPIRSVVLGTLDREGAMTSSDLAARRRVRPQTMAVTVKELVGLGWLTTTPHPADGRKVLLDLSDEGRAVLRADREGRVRRIADGLRQHLRPADLDTLADAVHVLAHLTERLGGSLGEPLLTASRPPRG